MKKICSLILFSICILSGNAQSNPISSNSFSFNYNQIPFGETLPNVLKLIDSTRIKKNIENVDFIYNFKINDYFSGGLYSSWFNYVLSPTVTKCYSISYNNEDKLKSIKLYFASSWDSRNNEDRYTLFMVLKEQKAVGNNYKDIFSSYKKSISSVIGVTSDDFTIKYQDASLRNDHTYEPGLIGIWKLKTRKVFLLIHNEFLGSSDPIILYVDNSGWNKYLKAIEKMEIVKKKENENKNKPDF